MQWRNFILTKMKYKHNVMLFSCYFSLLLFLKDSFEHYKYQIYFVLRSEFKYWYTELENGRCNFPLPFENKLLLQLYQAL